MKLFFAACVLIAATACVTALSTGDSSGVGRSTLEQQRHAADEVLAHAIQSGSRNSRDAAALMAATPDLSPEERLELRRRLAAINEDHAEDDARPAQHLP